MVVVLHYVGNNDKKKSLGALSSFSALFFSFVVLGIESRASSALPHKLCPQ
jgi:hypothetical protein